MFVDASAIVAILVREPGHEELIARLEEAVRPLTSALAVFEAVTAVVRLKKLDVARARVLVERFLDICEVEIAAVTDASGGLALEAFDNYGKGRGHPAQLNLGDCFAYAMAKQHGVALLYKGDDFSATDLA